MKCIIFCSTLTLVSNGCPPDKAQFDPVAFNSTASHEQFPFLSATEFAVSQQQQQQMVNRYDENNPSS